MPYEVTYMERVNKVNGNTYPWLTIPGIHPSFLLGISLDSKLPTPTIINYPLHNAHNHIRLWLLPNLAYPIDHLDIFTCKSTVEKLTTLEPRSRLLLTPWPITNEPSPELHRVPSSAPSTANDRPIRHHHCLYCRDIHVVMLLQGTFRLSLEVQ